MSSFSFLESSGANRVCIQARGFTLLSLLFPIDLNRKLIWLGTMHYLLLRLPMYICTSGRLESKRKLKSVLASSSFLSTLVESYCVSEGRLIVRYTCGTAVPSIKLLFNQCFSRVTSRRVCSHNQNNQTVQCGNREPSMFSSLYAHNTYASTPFSWFSQLIPGISLCII